MSRVSRAVLQSAPPKTFTQLLERPLRSTRMPGKHVSARADARFARRCAPARAAAPTSAGVEPSQSSLASRLRRDFPILDQTVHEKPLVYLDSAATSQKPTAVLEAVRHYYDRDNANVHRGVHTLASRATAAYEAARGKVAGLINASSDREVVWTKGATEAINLVAYSWGMHNLSAGDEVVISIAEHHANVLPWQHVCAATGATLKHVGLTPSEEVDLDALAAQVTDRTKLVCLVHVSNTLGAVLDTQRAAEIAHSAGAKLLLDCCQSVPHMPVDVQVPAAAVAGRLSRIESLQVLGADWIVASGHKMCGPTGIGFLWGRYDLLESMPPWQGGGEMIQEVYIDRATYMPPPMRFEAGTPAIAEVIGIGAAVDYLQETAGGMAAVHEHEVSLSARLYERLASVPGVRIYGPPPDAPRGRAALAAFNVDGLHATDISMVLDAAGVAVRSGHHCTQPLHRHLGVAATARASTYLYNGEADVDAFVDALKDSIQFFETLHP